MSGRAELLDEMRNGYLDGTDPEAPEPSANRSESYRHGFAMARNDRAGRPGAGAARNLVDAARAIAKDEDR